MKPIATNGRLIPVLLFSLAFLIPGIGCSGNTDEVANKQSAEIDDRDAVAASDTLNITGKLICAHCYALNENNTGHDHTLPQSGFKENCANFCSLQGYPMAVLLDEELAGQRVWVIRTSSQLFADFMTQTLRIEGTFVSHGVIDPLSIELLKSEEENQWITIM